MTPKDWASLEEAYEAGRQSVIDEIRRHLQTAGNAFMDDALSDRHFYFTEAYRQLLDDLCLGGVT